MHVFQLNQWADCGAVDDFADVVVAVVAADAAGVVVVTIADGNGVVDRFRRVIDELHYFRSSPGSMPNPDVPSIVPLQNLMIYRVVAVDWLAVALLLQQRQ